MSVRGVGLAMVSACTSDAIVVVVILPCKSYNTNPKLRAEVTGFQLRTAILTKDPVG